MVAVKVRDDQIQHWPCQDDDCIDCPEHFRHRDDMFQQWMPYDRGLPVAEAKDITARLSSTAKAGQRKLRASLERHGDLFMSRWKKRSKDKRADLLKRASNLLPEKRGMAFLELTQSNGGCYDWKQSRSDKFRFSVLLPYLAMDILKDNPAFLFALLHYRTTHSLEDWATFDMHQLRGAWINGLLVTNYSPVCVVVHGPNYGGLVPFDAKAVHRGDITGFPRAELLLEAQANLMEFLSRVMDFTLEGANLDNHSSTKWDTMCNEGFRLSGQLTQWSSYSNQPFSAPPVLDIESIISTATLRFNATADHLSLLQTDPAYMRRYMRITLQGAAFKNIPANDAFCTIDGEISYEIQSLYFWLCVKEEAEHVRDVRQRFRDQIHRGSTLPRPYDRALASLELVLVNHMNLRGHVCQNEAQQRPGFAKYFKREYQGQGTVIIRKNFEGALADKLTSDPLFWCLCNLGAEPDDRSSIDHASLFTFLEDHLAQAPAEERARLDQILVEYFSDLAATHQLLLAVRLNRPQDKAGDSDEMLITEDRRAWRDKLIRAEMMDPSLTRGLLLKRLYETTPRQGRMDTSWLEHHKTVHSTLSSYWASVRKSIPGHLKVPEIAPYLEADLDTGHQAELISERQSVLDEISSRRIVPDVLRDVPNPPEAAEKVRPAEKNPKPKTRPAVSSEQTSEHPAETTTQMPETTTPVPTIPTTKRALTVFSRMFNPSISETSQTCDWDQFVHAMKDVGFSTRNSTGSAVVFELSEQGKIIFHRPHPVAKIDPVMLKARGKRLS